MTWERLRLWIIPVLLLAGWSDRANARVHSKHLEEALLRSSYSTQSRQVRNLGVGNDQSSDIVLSIDIQTGGAQFHVEDGVDISILGGMSLAGQPLRLVSSRQVKFVDETLGNYRQATFVWQNENNNFQMETRYNLYEQHSMIVFEQYFKTGWEPQSSSSPDNADLPTIVTPFPSLDLTTIPCSDEWGYLLWGDCFLTSTWAGDWADLTTEDWGHLFDGDTFGQPWVLHNSADRTLVWSSFDNFFVSGVATSGAHNDTLEYGLRSTLQSIPEGYLHSTVVMAGNRGINATLMDWGDVLMAHGKTGKQRANVYDDFILAHLGYWTDNGAFHYRGAHPDHDNMQEALLDVKASLANNEIPIRYMQWDDWWMESKGDIPGMLSWEPKPEVFPSGFTDWLGMPLAMYAPEYSGENVWIQDYTWKTAQIPRGSTAIPLDEMFYRDLFRNGTLIGMKWFEQDFLCSYGIGDSGLTGTDVNSGHQWLSYMDAAARAFGIKLQFCMPDAYHLLESTKIYSVTNARATGDNTRSYRSIHPMGQNGLLFYALGVFASRDNVWTSNALVEQTGCGNQDFCYEPNAHLDNVVAVLSGGPYGIADKAGFTNKTLVMYSCRPDGLLLRPRWPLAALDFTYTTKEAKGTSIWAAHDDFGNYRWSYVVGVDLEKEFTISPSQLLQGAMEAGYSTMVAWPVQVGESVSKVFTFSDACPFRLPKSQPIDHLPYDAIASTHTHFAMAPVLPNGMVILGETGKWATMSFGRVTRVDTTGSSATVRLLGAPSELITLSYLSHAPATPDDTVVRSIDCRLPPASDCQEVDQHGNRYCELWIICQLSSGCTCSNTGTTNPQDTMPL